MNKQRVVVSESEVVLNISSYVKELPESPSLAARIKQHPAWYAIKDEDNKWHFGPSKFIGYANANATQYLASYSRKDGRETEPTLAQWFEQVDIQTALGGELKNAFIAFAGKFGKTPNANWRVSVLREQLAEVSHFKTKLRPTSERITFDANICGGRPRIAGTRMRVSDILSMFADGADRKTILLDFPYLTDSDLTSALEYAAKSTNHLVMRAA